MSIDLKKGARWGPQIADHLERTRFGIVCLTPENVTAPWILFEAGAISKTKDATLCPFLIDLSPADVEQPLGQFQYTSIDKTEVARLFRDINTQIALADQRALEPQLLTEIFDETWPELEGALRGIAADPPEEKVTARSKDAILDEILTTIRSLERRQSVLEYERYFLGDAPPENSREAIAREAARARAGAPRRIEDVLQELVQLVSGTDTGPAGGDADL